MDLQSRNQCKCWVTPSLCVYLQGYLTVAGWRSEAVVTLQWTIPPPLISPNLTTIDVTQVGSVREYPRLPQSPSGKRCHIKDFQQSSPGMCPVSVRHSCKERELYLSTKLSAATERIDQCVQGQCRQRAHRRSGGLFKTWSKKCLCPTENSRVSTTTFLGKMTELFSAAAGESYQLSMLILHHGYKVMLRLCNLLLRFIILYLSINQK